MLPAGGNIVHRQVYLDRVCSTTGLLPESAVCFAGQNLARLQVSTGRPQAANQTLTLGLADVGASSPLHRSIDTWSAAVALNQSYRLTWGSPVLGDTEIAVFPLPTGAYLTLNVGLAAEAGVVTVGVGNETLQLTPLLPNEATVSAAALSNGVLSVRLVGSLSSQSQVGLKESSKSDEGCNLGLEEDGKSLLRADPGMPTQPHC